LINKRIIRGREITTDAIVIICDLIKSNFSKDRKYYSRILCHYWEWYQPNGYTKDITCRYILLSLENDGLIKLPPHLNSVNNQKKKALKIVLDRLPLTGTVKDHPSLELKMSFHA
jgi:hypothetical protein